jgi:Mn-dependent DtxR family transcriptional regulator
MATVLGVRRESVTEAAGRLQSAGLIRCARGHIAVLDPAGMERRSCECHAVVKTEYKRLLPMGADVRPEDPTRWASPARHCEATRRSVPKRAVGGAVET